MTNRRTFIRTTGLAATGIALGGYSFAQSIAVTSGYLSNRPDPAKRKFVSRAVEDKIAAVKAAIRDPELAWMFENCFPNTLDTTVTYTEVNGKPDTFVITGDIHAMWLRDSTAQVWPYLPLIRHDKALQNLIAGVINRQVKCIRLDPYANAFLDGNLESEWKSDITEMKPGIHERKWEIDSLCYPIRLSYGYWKTTGDMSLFDDNWVQAMKLAVKTLKQQQRKDGRGPYSFKRTTAWQTDTVAGNGWGNPAKPNGLIVSIFRPSDDATIFPYLIPSNYFAAKSLTHLSEIFDHLQLCNESDECRAFADEIYLALYYNARVVHPEFGEIYAYETDGYGNRLMMDDSNVPSLLALPYLGCVELNDTTYQNTRKFVLSRANPYFFWGSAAEGIGSPHTLNDKIWPMTIIMRAMTSNNAEEIISCLRMLKTTHAGTGFMHESFHKDNPNDYTRNWFAWANTLFGELIYKLHAEQPVILATEF